jgi:hypothetical protein
LKLIGKVLGRRIADAIDNVDDLADLRHFVLPEIAFRPPLPDRRAA